MSNPNDFTLTGSVKKSIRIDQKNDAEITRLAEEINTNYSQALNIALASFFARNLKDERFLKTILRQLVKTF